jgi:hypothetical protein
MKRFPGFGGRRVSLSPDGRNPHAAGGINNKAKVASIESPMHRHQSSPRRKSFTGDVGFRLAKNLGDDFGIASSPPSAKSSDRNGKGADGTLADPTRTGAGVASKNGWTGASPLPSFLGRSFLGRTSKKLDGKGLQNSSECQSPRASNASAPSEASSVSLRAEPSHQVTSNGPVSTAIQESETPESSTSGRNEEEKRVVVVAFDANVQGKLSHGAIVWALQTVVKKGDVLVLVGVLDYVRGPLGYKCLVQDETWLGANKKFLDEEVKLREHIWSALPGLRETCEAAAVKLEVVVKAAHKLEVAVVEESAERNACHVVLAKSLKNRRRNYYLENLACDVTRLRRSGGLDSIRSSRESILHDGNFAASRSPTSVILPRLSYKHQTDSFKINLRPKKVVSTEDNSSITSSSAPTSARVSVHTNHLQSSFTSSGTSTSLNDGMDDELFCINHRSSSLIRSNLDSDFLRLAEQQYCPSGYESDDLFSIGNASTRRESFALSGPKDMYSVRNSAASNHDAFVFRNSRRLSDADAMLLDHSRLAAVELPSSRRASSAVAINLEPTSWDEPLTEATIARMIFVVGLGDVVEVNVCNALQSGQALLVGASPAALFLVHNEGSMFQYQVIAGPPNAYVAVEGRMVMKLNDLVCDQRVVVVNAQGRSTTVSVVHTTRGARPLVLVEAHVEGRQSHTVMLHHASSVCMIARVAGAAVPVSVKDLKVGDKVLCRLRSAQYSSRCLSSRFSHTEKDDESVAMYTPISLLCWLDRNVQRIPNTSRCQSMRWTKVCISKFTAVNQLFFV